MVPLKPNMVHGTHHDHIVTVTRTSHSLYVLVQRGGWWSPRIDGSRASSSLASTATCSSRDTRVRTECSIDEPEPGEAAEEAARDFREAGDASWNRPPRLGGLRIPPVLVAPPADAVSLGVATDSALAGVATGVRVAVGEPRAAAGGVAVAGWLRPTSSAPTSSGGSWSESSAVVGTKVARFWW